LAFRKVGSPDHSIYLVTYLLTRFRNRGSTADLQEIVLLKQAVLELCPLGRPDHTMTSHNLLVHERDTVNNDDFAMDTDGIVNLARASLIPSHGHPDHIMSLTTLATSLRCRFRQQDAITDLDEAIDLYRRALDVCPSESPACASVLHDLARCLYDRFTKLATTSDLQDAIKYEQTALNFRPPGHPDHAQSHDSLANYLQLKMKCRGALSQLEHSSGPISSSRTRKMIGHVVFEVLKAFPPRLLETHTGTLCGRDLQILRFEQSQVYNQLLASSSALDNLPSTSHIREVVSTYFRYVTLSHRWGRFEPLLRDIEGQAVYDLDPTDGLSKLQFFCLTSFRHGYLWAWSDTCCIDKDSSAELQEAIGSMFSWYRQSALTMVHLADVLDGGVLTDSEWFKRGWTLQELLAPRTMLFFTRDWSLYKDGTSPNHKENSIIIGELKRVTRIASRHLTHFHPGVDDPRSMLEWASARCTTRPEDIAYSLLGIFNLHIPVLYGESEENALGRLLAEVISKSGDTSILDWVGQPSSFHSCFPATLTPYQTFPPSQPLSADPRRCSFIGDIWKKLFAPGPRNAARKMHQALSNLPRTQFTNFRLLLPCIIYRIQTIRQVRVDTSSGMHIHQIHAVGLEPIEIALSEKLKNTSRKRAPYILIRPRHSDLLNPDVETDDTSAHEWLARLEQPFSALLLTKLPHFDEYRRVASSCNIIARPTDSAGVLKGQVGTLTIV